LLIIGLETNKGNGKKYVLIEKPFYLEMNLEKRFLNKLKEYFNKNFSQYFLTKSK
jgi:hypothetical protein